LRAVRTGTATLPTGLSLDKGLRTEKGASSTWAGWHAHTEIATGHMQGVATVHPARHCAQRTQLEGKTHAVLTSAGLVGEGSVLDFFRDSVEGVGATMQAQPQHRKAARASTA
jgi:hypothetical protein